jgi:hypothetical protein
MNGWIKAYSDIFIKYLFGSPDSNDLLLLRPPGDRANPATE